MTRPEDTYAIARIDLPGASTHGWQVRLQRRGRKYGKFFADRLHGGTREAYRVARAWRNALIERLDERESGPRVCLKSARNSSGRGDVFLLAGHLVSGARSAALREVFDPSPRGPPGLPARGRGPPRRGESMSRRRFPLGNPAQRF